MNDPAGIILGFIKPVCDKKNEKRRGWGGSFFLIMPSLIVFITGKGRLRLTDQGVYFKMI